MNKIARAVFSLQGRIVSTALVCLLALLAFWCAVSYKDGIFVIYGIIIGSLGIAGIFSVLKYKRTELDSENDD